MQRDDALARLPNQIDGLAQCAEASGATPNATLLLKLAAAEQRIQRLTDMCRVARHHLHDEDLIEDHEFAALVADSEGGERRARIEGYDAMRKRIAELEAEVKKLRESDGGRFDW